MIPSGFVQELRGSCEWEVVFYIETVGAFSDSITSTGWHFPWFAAFKPMLESVGAVRQKLQPVYGRTSLAKVEITVSDRSEWKEMLSMAYVKNQLAEIWIGPKGANYHDFYKYFTGIIINYKINDDKVTFTMEDDLYLSKERIPEVNDTNTQTLTYSQQNPYDIISNIIGTQLSVSSDHIDSTSIESERDTWFLGWVFHRVITNPVTAKILLDELQEETHSFIYTDGDKYKIKAFAPRTPGQSLYEITNNQIAEGSLSLDARMDDNFFNRCEVYYDYDESGGGQEENYESLVDADDTTSQSNWGETSTKIIKSKWLRTYAWTQPSNITGVTVYHASKINGAGDGTLTYNSAAQTLSWTAPGDGGAGDTVEVDRDGRYQLFATGSETKYVRVVVTTASLPAGNQTDTITLTATGASIYANSIAHHYVARYSTPQSEIGFDLPMVDAIFQDDFLKPSNLVEITTDRVATKGEKEWENEVVLLLSAKMEFGKRKMSLEGIQTGFRRKYGFIGPTTMTNDYDSATTAEKEYAFIADTSNYLGASNADSYYIW